jgi:membrane protein
MIKQKLQQLQQFLKKDIWKIPASNFTGSRGFFLRQLKVLLLAVHKFDQKHSRLQAASMTYYSVLALVPSVTLIYGLMKGFGLEGMLREQLYRNLSSHKELVDYLFSTAQIYVDKTSGTVFAGIGVALLLWSIFKTLSTIEEAFNDTWGVSEGKPILRKLSDYLTVFLICPLLIILSGSVTLFVSTQVHSVAEKYFYLGPLIPMVYAALFVLPFLVIWLVFTFIYTFMPNTQVKFTSGLWGGLIAGTLYQLNQWCYIVFQVWINQANAIYGGLAAIPLFMVWLQLSWMIMLFGSEVAFARQYLKTYHCEPDNIKCSPWLRKLIGLLIMHTCVKNFERGGKPQTAQYMAEHLHLPAFLVQEAINELLETDLLSRIYVEDDKIFAYHPARTIETITVDDVLEAIEHHGQEDVPIRESQELKVIASRLEKFNGRLKQLGKDILLKEL